MFAVISHKGKQYKVYEDKECEIDFLGDTKQDEKINFSEVLLIGGEKKVIVGSPTIEGAVVEAKIMDQIRKEKIEVFKFEAKKRYKRTKGHREQYSLVKILKIKTKNEE